MFDKKILPPRILQIATLTAGFALLYHHTIFKLVIDWSADDNFSHGFLVPIIAGYMIWHYRERLLRVAVESSYWGYLLLLGGMLFHIAGNIGAELFVQRLSIILTLMGLTSILFGLEVLKIILVPLLYLLLMIPIPAIIWNQIAFPMQLFAAKLSSDAITMVGIAVLREGNILHLANTSLEVVDACSGLRSLMSMLALSTAFAYISSLKNTGKWILFLSAFPIAIIVNVFRLTITAIMAKVIGPETAQGFLHDMSGLIIFFVALILLYFTQAVLVRIRFLS
ncbi:exosortase/archaeosortase family protein [Desulfosarcina sp.]|uniref:exosortase/archaeosortase family protein n=1 Tax=Desulfosarcina sp. TaxID=2027861 RepID=UPI0035692D05